jgi:hypothetical protein
MTPATMTMETIRGVITARLPFQTFEGEAHHAADAAEDGKLRDNLNEHVGDHAAPCGTIPAT